MRIRAALATVACVAAAPFTAGAADSPAAVAAAAPVPVRAPAPVRVPTAQVPVRAGAATVPVRCAAQGAKGCRGVLRLRATVGGRSQIVGRRAYVVAPGTTVGVDVPLSPSGRAALARSDGRLVVTAAAGPTDGSAAPAGATRSVRLVSRVAVAERPSLSFVVLEGTAEVLGDCDPATHRLTAATYRATGRSTGSTHYPGTFTEQGTFTRTDPATGQGDLRLSFTIVSGATTITGTRTFVVPAAPCYKTDDPRNFLRGSRDFGTYEATIRTVTGSGPTASETTATDRGFSDFQMDENTRLMRGTFLPQG